MQEKPVQERHSELLCGRTWEISLSSKKKNAQQNLHNVPFPVQLWVLLWHIWWSLASWVPFSIFFCSWRMACLQNLALQSRLSQQWTDLPVVFYSPVLPKSTEQVIHHYSTWKWLWTEHQKCLFRIHISMHLFEKNGDPSNVYVLQMHFQRLQN